MSKLTPDVIFTTNYGGGIRNETQFQQSSMAAESWLVKLLIMQLKPDFFDKALAQTNKGQFS